MNRIPRTTRTYQVAGDDFPINVEARAMNLSFCQAVASDVQIAKEGMLMDSIPVTAKKDPARLAIGWTIPEPKLSPELVLTEVVVCMFPKAAPANSKYQVTIISSKGDMQQTNGSRPTINPRKIKLKFLYR
jgi:hypothetical protein